MSTTTAYETDRPLPGIERADLDLLELSSELKPINPESRDLLVDPYDPLATLTPVEASVVQKAAEDLTNEEIGKKLGITAESVGNRLSFAYEKLGIKQRDQLGIILFKGYPIPEVDLSLLTKRQREVFQLLGDGLTTKEIATQLGINNLHKVVAHLLRIRERLGIEGRVALRRVAYVKTSQSRQATRLPDKMNIEHFLNIRKLARVQTAVAKTLQSAEVARFRGRTNLDKPDVTKFVDNPGLLAALREHDYIDETEAVSRQLSLHGLVAAKLLGDPKLQNNMTASYLKAPIKEVIKKEVRLFYGGHQGEWEDIIKAAYKPQETHF